LPKKITPRAGQKENKILVFGIGNPGRRDDGLGARFVSQLQAEKLEGADCDSNYQLQVEDALTLLAYGTAIYVDASKKTKAPFTFEEIFPSLEISFSTHELSPQSVLSLCQELYHHRPRAFLLAIRGYEWGVGEFLSDKAEANLSLALDFLKGHLKESRGSSPFQASAAKKKRK
jgi:hydrogenase maturation protease